MSTFTELVRKRRQSGGTIGGSLSYGLRERAKETFDPRRIFKQDGLLTALFPKLRAYKSGKVGDIKKSSSKLTPDEISSTEPLLDSIQQNTKISAKNSLVLPAIHRDVNIIRQNVIKLVKLKGGQSTNKADMWFIKASTMEAAYENLLKNGKKSKDATTKDKKEDKSPTKDDEGKGSFFSSILPLASMVTSVIATIGALATTLIATVTKLIANPLALLSLLGITSASILSMTKPGTLGNIANNIREFRGIKNPTDGQSTGSSGENEINAPTKKDAWGKTANVLDIVENKTGGEYLEKFGKPLAGAAAGAYIGSKVGKYGFNKYQQNKTINEKINKKIAETSRSIPTETKAKRPLYDKKMRSDTALKKAEEASVKQAERLYEKVKIAYDKLVKKGLAGKFAKRLSSKLWKMGKFVLAKIVGKFILGLTVTAASAGVGAAVGALIIASSVYDVITMLQICLDIYKEIMDEEGETTSPTQEQPKGNTLNDFEKENKEFGKRNAELTQTPPITSSPEQIAQTKLQNDKKIYESEAFKKWQEEKNAGFSEKGMFAKYGVDAYRKEMGDKLAESSAGIVDAKRAAQKPVVNVRTKEKTETLPTKSSTGSLEQASVYDLHFMKRLGLQYDYSGVAN